MKNKQTSQDQIIKILSSSGGMTTRNLALACGLDEPAVRYHLRHLINLGFVSAVDDQENSGKPGRRAKRYFSNVKPAASNSIQSLCEGLLQYFREGSQNNSELTDYLASFLIHENYEYPIRQTSLTSVIRSMVEWMSTRNYLASWEAGRNGPEILFRNCPYHEILKDNEILCEVDIKLLNAFSGNEWQMVEQINRESLRGCCRFIVKS